VLGYAPARIPDLLAAGPALISVRLRAEGGQLRVRGRTPAGDWDAALDVRAIEAGKGNAAVVTLYGREAVEDLEVGAAGGKSSVDAQLERLGLQYQIATRLTSWVAVSEEPGVDPTQPSRRERMPQALPAGLSAEGLGLRAARGMGRVTLSQRMPFSSTDARRGSKAPELPDFVGEVSFLRRGVPPAERRGRKADPAEHRDGIADPSSPLVGRLVHRRDRQLVVEITIDRLVDWEPAAVEVGWDEGARLMATVDPEHTTRAGRLRPGLVARLVLRLDADGPLDAPSTLVVHGGHGDLRVRLVTG
jgi:Ca-activated chloride channel family protein